MNSTLLSRPLISLSSSSANAHPQYCQSSSDGDVCASESFARSSGVEASAGWILWGAVGKRISIPCFSRDLRRAPAFLENSSPVLQC